MGLRSVAMQHRAIVLRDDTASLRRKTPSPLALAAGYGVDALPASPVLLNLLKTCTATALRRAGQVEEALGRAKPSPAMALITSAITYQQPFVPTCYGSELVSRAPDLWA